MNSFNLLTVYLGSSGHARPVFKQAAQELGTLIGAHKKHLVYGGMDAGLMGILATAAMKAGAHVTGIIPRKIKDSERILSGLNDMIMVEDLCDRKKQMFLMADAILALPGGFGTLDESLEVLYWGGLGLHNKPLLLINIEDYWGPLITYLKTLPDFDDRFLIVVDSVAEALPALENYSPPPRVKVPPHLPHFEDEITRDTAMPIIVDRANVENTYFVICALGLKQLDKHQRHIGFLNDQGQFDDLLKWITQAHVEKFVTDYCVQLFDVDADEETLRAKLKDQPEIHIDLHTEKWGSKS